MQILVVGGAGYIGSHMVKHLVENGFAVTVLDNLSTGHRDAVPGARFVLGDLFERDALEHVCQDTAFDGVMHFASCALAAESVYAPAKYYRNNVFKTQNLLDVMVARRIRCLVFSSSAAIFGEPLHLSVAEQHPVNPLHPYGRSQWMVEQMLEDYDIAYGLKSVCLRRFNVAGVDPHGELGERHQPETHLIPRILQVASGRQPHITVFGNDYPTPDGTGVRDYLHVHDLCTAHLLALQRLWAGGTSRAYNLGSGQGFSVKEVIDTAIKVTGRPIPVQYGERRLGDVACRIADPRRAKAELGWAPRHVGLSTLMAHAWQRETQHPD